MSQLSKRETEPRYYAEWPVEPVGRARSVSGAQVFALLRRRVWLVALFLLLGIAGGVLVILTSEPRYVATSQLIIDPRGPRVMDNEVTPSIDNADAQVATVENEMRVLKSSAVLDSLIAREKLNQDPEFIGDPPSVLRRLKSAVLALFNLEPTRVGDPRVAIIQALDRKIAVRRTERSFVVDVTVTTRDPEKSARIANDLIEIYTAAANTARSDLARRTGASLDDRLAELRTAMRTAEDRVEAFKVKHDLATANGVLTRDQRLRDLNAQLSTARIRTGELQARVEQTTGLRDTLDTMPEAVQSEVVTQLRGQIAEARRRQANLANNLGPRHPELAAIGKEIDGLRQLVNQELRRIADAARNDYKRAKQAEDGLQKSVESLSRTSFTDSRAKGELRELEREADARRTLFAQYLVRSRELNEQTRVDLNNVRPIGAAIPPETPANLSKAVILGLGALIGLIGGTLLAVLVGVLRGEIDGTPEPPATGEGAPARALTPGARATGAASYIGPLKNFG